MSQPRLKTELWIKAQLRLCDQAFIPAVIARRGDSDSGQVLIKRLGVGGQMRACEVMARRFTGAGERAWMVVAQGGEGDCDGYIAREADIDPDLWVLEIEDTKDVYRPDGQAPLRDG